MILSVNKLPIVSKCNRFGILLPKSAVLQLRLESILFCCLCFGLLAVFGIYLFMFRSHTKYLVIEKLAALLCFFIDECICLLFWASNQIYSTICHKFGDEVKIKMSQRIFTSEEIISKKHNEFENLCDWLSFGRQFHSKIVRAFNDFNSYSNPLTVIWLLITMSVIITNAFCTIVAIANGNTDIFKPELIGMKTQLYFSSLALTADIVLLQQLQNVSEDILSFLFKYPISKLTPAEAAQVEMLITTLTIQKPVLRASDIFTVGTRLLASISGTVVTYVLVALQFHASWTKQ